ncbi:MAG: dNTP triphosphohydrolase [Vampirovibrionales bacterium]
MLSTTQSMHASGLPLQEQAAAQGLHSFATPNHHPQHTARTKAENPCPLRSDFQRDRDRILHSKAFRRLAHKTQVFISPQGDHYRTRLTHSLEVSQIARTAARALGLNEDLTEAIALGHDLGHPPFGHTGESILSEQATQLGLAPFRHEAHSVRIVTVLEPLNLTQAVLHGMEDQLSTNPPRRLEAQLVKLTDRMTYLHHDVEDATRAGLMDEAQIPEELCLVLGRRRTERLDTMVLDLVRYTQQLWAQGEQRVSLSPAIEGAMNRLRKWMFDTVYLSPRQRAQHTRVERLLTGLFEWYHTHPNSLPEGFNPPIDSSDEDYHQAIVDYLAGMTDRYAIEQGQRLLLPTPYTTGTESFGPLQ